MIVLPPMRRLSTLLYLMLGLSLIFAGALSAQNSAEPKSNRQRYKAPEPLHYDENTDARFGILVLGGFSGMSYNPGSVSMLGTANKVSVATQMLGGLNVALGARFGYAHFVGFGFGAEYGLLNQLPEKQTQGTDVGYLSFPLFFSGRFSLMPRKKISPLLAFDCGGQANYFPDQTSSKSGSVGGAFLRLGIGLKARIAPKVVLTLEPHYRLSSFSTLALGGKGTENTWLNTLGMNLGFLF